MELSAIAFEPLPHLLHVRLPLGFEVHNLNCVSLAADEVNLALYDVVGLYQGDIDLRLLYLRPVAMLSVYIA